MFCVPHEFHDTIIFIYIFQMIASMMAFFFSVQSGITMVYSNLLLDSMNTEQSSWFGKYKVVLVEENKNKCITSYLCAGLNWNSSLYVYFLLRYRPKNVLQTTVIDKSLLWRQKEKQTILSHCQFPVKNLISFNEPNKKKN